MKATLIELLQLEWRLLTFRATSDDLLSLDKRHLWFGLAFVWLAGMGRNWDNPDAMLPQALGLGSLLYVCCLALFLWFVWLPLKPDHSGYLFILTFIALTAPPALLYAIPVEKVLPPGPARTVNLCLLGLVAAWRVALLVRFLKSTAFAKWYEVTIATLLPLATIVAVVGIWREFVNIMEHMGGLREGGDDIVQRVANAMVALALLSWVPLVICYAAIASSRSRS